MHRDPNLNAHAFALTQALLDLFGPCLREEERLLAAHEVMDLVKQALQRFEGQRNRFLRYRPGRN